MLSNPKYLRLVLDFLFHQHLMERFDRQNLCQIFPYFIPSWRAQLTSLVEALTYSRSAPMTTSIRTSDFSDLDSSGAFW